MKSTLLKVILKLDICTEKADLMQQVLKLMKLNLADWFVKIAKQQ